jgi:phenylacetic acid degradation operon negative regulatory protein
VDRVTPKSLLLDLLRVALRPVPVRELVSVGALFGLEGNAIRVALTRLVGRGLVVSDERGSYGLAAGADPVRRWVEGWRLGDRRLRPWTGAWLCAWHPRGGGRGERQLSHRALGRLGFREGRDQLWVRPDNLRARAAALQAELILHGAAAGTLLFVGQELPAAVIDGWVGALWPIEEVAGRHRRALRDIERSRARLERLAGGGALVESFLVGGAAIRSLALDPLLPDEIAPGVDRRALTDAMRDYERRGRAIWSRVLQSASLDGSPSHVGAISAEP